LKGRLHDLGIKLGRMLATGRYASAFDLWKEMDVEPSILVRLSYL
jgi:hypothetical protein